MTENYNITDSVEEFENLNMIRQMFTDSEISILNDFIENNEITTRQPETLAKKCALLFLQFGYSEFCKTNIPSAELRHELDNTSEDELKSLLVYFVNYVNDVSVGRNSRLSIKMMLKEIRKDKQAYQNYLLRHGMRKEDELTMRSELSICKSITEALPVFAKYWRKLLVLQIEYENCLRYNHVASFDESEVLRILDGACQLHENFPSLCERIESLCGNVLDLPVYSQAFLRTKISETDLALAYLFLCSFCYSITTKENWKDIIFREAFSYMYKSQLTGFLLFLNLSVEEGGSPYVEDFCDAMEHYCQENNIEPAIKLDLVKRRNKHLIPDNTKYDTPQFVRVLNSKLKGVASKNPEAIDRLLYNNLNKLYDKLIEKSYIAKDTDKDLFIYRLSGLNRPDGKELGKIVMEKGMATKMGYILRCLCSDDKEDFKSSILNNFFLSNSRKKPEFSTAKYQSGEDFKKNRSLVDKNFSEAVDLLVNIGFVNSETIHKGRTKA